MMLKASPALTNSKPASRWSLFSKSHSGLLLFVALSLLLTLPLAACNLSSGDASESAAQDSPVDFQAVGESLSLAPETTITRGLMSVLLLKGMEGEDYLPPTPDGGVFDDVVGHYAEAWIEELAERGITGGYGDGTYRPDSPVTRAEMAVFLMRAKHGSDYEPPPVDSSRFSDVAGNWAEDWIEALAVEGVTSGYEDGTYKPDTIVVWGEMVLFLDRMFNPG